MIHRIAKIALSALALSLLSGCEVLKFGVVGHAGPVAAQTWHLYLIVGSVLVFVAGPVLLLVPIFAWHYRLSNRKSAYRPDWDFAWWVEGLIWIPPTAIVVGLAFVLWHYTHQLDPYRPVLPEQPALEVQAVGFDWKWLFIYPGERVAAVNQLAIPVGRPVHIALTSGTVMQSMMVPQLAGQIYAMAGMTTQLNFASTKTGVYRGENTQFNGDGFQNEKFDVIALPPAAYDRWIARVKASAHPLDGHAFDVLFSRTVAPQPIFYSATPPGVFRTIMTRSQAPGR